MDGLFIRPQVQFPEYQKFYGTSVFGLLVTSTTKSVLRGSILIFSICYQIQFHFQFSSCLVFQSSVFFFVYALFAFDTMCAEFS